MKQTPEWSLDTGEVLLWQGRPAPRCYVFSHWFRSLLGCLLFLAASFWTILGWQLLQAGELPFWVVLLPCVITLGAFLVGPCALIYRRWRWEGIFYLLTTRRLLIRSGRSRLLTFDLEQYEGVQKKTYGEHLASLKLCFSQDRSVILECLEHPELLVETLPSKRL